MGNTVEKPERFVQYMLHSFLRVENLCFLQSVLKVIYPCYTVNSQAEVHISVITGRFSHVCSN